MPISTTGDSLLIAKIANVDMSTAGGTDIAFAVSTGLKSGTSWICEKVLLANTTQDPNGFHCGIFTQTLQGGQTIAAFNISVAGLVSSTSAAVLAGIDGPNNTNFIGNVITANTAYLHVNGPATAGGTGDLYLFGRILKGQ